MTPKSKLSLMLAFSTLAACANVPPPCGDPSYQTAALCVSPELADEVSQAADDWHEASPKVSLRVIQADGGDECDAIVTVAELPGHTQGDTKAGRVQIAKTALSDPRFSQIVSHEIGHLLLGPAWKAENPEDPGHHPGNEDLMSAHGGAFKPSADDVARLPRQD